MTDDPFLTLVVESLNLMHPRFAAANGREYPPAEAGEPAAAGKVRERSFLMEFYHEFRRLWDQALPVELGLGHLVVQGEPAGSDGSPDLLFHQLGEGHQPERKLAALSLAFLSNPLAIKADQALLSRYQKDRGYRYSVSAIVGRKTAIPDTGLSAKEGITVVFFDIDRWCASVIGNAGPGEPGA